MFLALPKVSQTFEAVYMNLAANEACAGGIKLGFLVDHAKSVFKVAFLSVRMGNACDVILDKHKLW